MIDIAGNTGITAIKLWVSYDTDVLTVKENAKIRVADVINASGATKVKAFLCQDNIIKSSNRSV